MREDSSRGSVAFFTYILALGGTERILSHLTSYLPGEYDVHIFAYDSTRIDYPFRGEISDLKLPFTYKGVRDEMKAMLKGVWRVRRLKREFNISLCISLLEEPNIINVLSGASQVIVSVHESKSARFRERFTDRFGEVKAAAARRLLRFVYNRADAVVAVSKGIAEDLIGNFGVQPRKVRVIYNPCDLEEVTFRAEEDIEAELLPVFRNPVIINAGRLTRQKGQWHLIRAFRRLKERERRAQLVILGEGEERTYLQNLTKELGLQGDVHFLGFRRNPFKYIAMSDIFVLSSLWEGFGNVLVEAMACGVPVISSDCPSGPREILAPDTGIGERASGIEWAKYGILVPVLDGAHKEPEEPLTEEESALAGAMGSLLSAEEKRRHYAELGHERVMDFSMDIFIGSWDTLIREFC